MIWILAFLYILPVFAHQTSFTPTGSKLYWPSESTSLKVKNFSNDINSSNTKSIIQNSLDEWNSIGSIQIENSQNSKNEVIFTNDFEIYGSAVVGITELSYNPSGVINKATIYLNDNYRFSTDPSAFVRGQVYLGDVITHEVGHFLGLSHSEVLDSSMFYSSFPGQSSISADDKSGILQKYGSDLGSIEGYVKGGNQIGVLGVHVQVISRQTGEVVGAVTDEDGYFLVAGLDVDNSYYIYTSPVKNPASLPGYFANVQTNFCPGSYSGSFFSECGREYEGIPQAINLTKENKNVDVGIVTINCGLKIFEDYSYSKIQDDFIPVDLVTNSETEFFERAFVGYFGKDTGSDFSSWETFNLDLSGIEIYSGDKIQIQLIGQNFGSQMEYEMELVRNDSVIQSGQTTYSFITGTYNTNINLQTSLSQSPLNNIYEIKVRAKKMSNTLVALSFPDPDAFSSEDFLPYLLITSLKRAGNLNVNTAAFLSDNESCLDAPYTYKVEKTFASDETNSNANSSSSEGAGCGTIDDSNNNGPGNLLGGFVFGLLMWQVILALGRKSKITLS